MPDEIKLVPVRFTSGFGVYAPGEIAGFLPERAKELIEKFNVAESYKPDGEKDEDPAPAEAEGEEGGEDEGGEGDGAPEGETRAQRRRRLRAERGG